MSGGGRRERGGKNLYFMQMGDGLGGMGIGFSCFLVFFFFLNGLGFLLLWECRHEHWVLAYTCAALNKLLFEANNTCI